MTTRGESPFPEKLPGPNLKGNYEGSCVLCLRGVDTCIGFEGEAEWIIAAHHKALGIPIDEAGAMLADGWGVPVGTVPSGVVTTYSRLCEVCAEKRGVRVALAGFEGPVYQQPS